MFAVDPGALHIEHRDIVGSSGMSIIGSTKKPAGRGADVHADAVAGRVETSDHELRSNIATFGRAFVPGGEVEQIGLDALTP